jgi:hypothetical protein
MIQYIATTVRRKALTMPGGNMASNRSTPNIPRFERTKVPAANKEKQRQQIKHMCASEMTRLSLCAINFKSILY